MELQNVGYFLALFAEENFVRAAKRCGIAQPSLTNAIKRLEQHVGGALFVRRPRVQPTPLAVALKPYFEQILLSVQITQEEAKRLAAPVARRGTKP
jgi:DNA-binding transcriptional LysR family regulator